MDAQAWLEEQDGQDESQRSYQYWMRPDPDMREFVGPIEEAPDPLTGRIARFRKAAVGMVRGVRAENRHEFNVYLAFDGVRTLPHIRTDSAKPLQGWYQSKSETRHGSRPRPCFTDAVLTQPYGGYCAVGCAFCYVNSGMKGYRASGLISVPIGYGDHVRKSLSRMKTATAGYFSSFTDPFLPLEDVYGNTRAGAEEFDRAGLPVFFLSRLHYPGWAVDLLARNKYSYAQKSLNTSVEEDWRRLSPGAIALEDHYAEIREFRRRGIYVSIQVNPIIAGITTHEHIEALFERLAEAGANHVIVKFVEANFPWAPAMADRIEQRFGSRADRFHELFIDNSAGNQRTIALDYRLDAHRRYQAKATALGLTYATCYEYAPDGNGYWRSVGADFLTADQCHGHRVPMFTRRSLAEPFAEVEECPPQGCLTCAEGSPGGKVPCGSELYGSAPALRMTDFKRSVYDPAPALVQIGAGKAAPASEDGGEA